MEEIKKTSSVPPAEAAEQPSSSPPVKPLAAVSKISDTKFTPKIIGVLVAVCLLGLASGYFLYAKQTAGTIRLANKDVTIIKTKTEEGVSDASTFRDTASGILQVNDGKITKEGSHILVRGDPSQNVYLTSSVVDMDKYVGKKVQVWGETFQGKTAGWLMDVGRIKLL